ncbi:hypothetical protein P6U16_22220 (plasmid) [Rhizobium sp. 32-5/1]|uniref:hypothetical protein n=1 Tax=Rhizobium sp. 32-5/1 TaxID=3019602 RepID=UPI00240E714F|nr:hypothetical protein [Rhizobium sp. 32-5/1]WEZ85760.1 hypothetical protein P6U16_22220 [Rhizobium sp. 32-5/1]
MVGQERWEYFYAFRTIKETGAQVVFASDWPVADLNVMRGPRVDGARSLSAAFA